MYHHLLVALDGSDRSVEGIGSAVGLARAVGARITFFAAEAALAGRPTSSAGAWPARARAAANETLAKAEAAARAHGVPCASWQGAHAKTADAIVQAARSNGCDLIFVASPPDAHLPAGPQALNALLDARLPVLWASPTSGPGAHAIGVIRDEHRSLAAALHAWQGSLAASRREGSAVDLPLMQATLRYLQIFPVALHHPKEEEHLFRRLRARTHAVDADLDELERQHARDRQLVADLARRVDRLAAAAAGSTTAEVATRELEDAVRHYTAFQWEHLGREEGVVLPAAQRHLTEADWQAIDAAFSREGSDGLGPGDADAEVRRLFARIVAAQRSG